MEDIKNVIGLNIKIYRAKAEMTQVQLAEKIGKSENQVVSYEKGRTSISVTMLDKIAKVLGVTAIDLMKPLVKEIERTPREMEMEAVTMFETLNPEQKQTVMKIIDVFSRYK